jgi:SAM-dependent methyltransferase
MRTGSRIDCLYDLIASIKFHMRRDTPGKTKMNKTIQDTQTSYDRVAVEYGERFKDEMDDKPFDRDCLNRLAREFGELGLICDMGCGPGQIARYLHGQGVKTLGVDLSAIMVAEAQRLNPEVHFHQGDMLSLPDANNSWGGIAAFYCIIHIPREQSVDALREMKRVLIPGGILLLAFHIGTEIILLDNWWDKPVNLDFAFYLPSEMESWLKEAGFELLETLVREPNTDVEAATQRAYIFAKKSIAN